MKEPIAIIGMACRFPGGAKNPAAFWNLLANKQDAIIEVPKTRWDLKRFYHENEKKPGKMYTKKGGFLQEDIYEFDPLFFGISPREAEVMDPQQRFLLMVAYEAFEQAGLRLEDLKQSNTGVFVGGFCLDNHLTQFHVFNRVLTDSNTAPSSTMSILANRLSYIFDLKGPSIAMDTACSSSLVATHVACQSIWSGDCEMALVGGSNIMTRPDYPIGMSIGRFLSKHGHCMTFDERASGYARSEGVGMVILKPLSKALEAGDRVISVIKNSGVNQDGGITQGITLPNGISQRELIERVYKGAAIDPSEVQYVEAHGTGTQAGDKTETKALDEVMKSGQERAEKCLVGSVKSNIGHMEAAAGVASLIKTALMLEKGQVLPNINFDTPNPEIPFDEMAIKVATELETWPVTTQAQRRASVNSFGYGGTNAHVLLESYTSTQQQQLVAAANNAAITSSSLLALPISAQDETALKKLVEAYQEQLKGIDSPTALNDLIYTATHRRSKLNQNVTFIAKDKAEFLELFQQFLQDIPNPAIITEKKLMEQDEPLPKVFVFTGMGPQWYKMGQELFAKEPVFADFVQRADVIFQKIAGWSILAEMQKNEADSKMSETNIAQPANFVLQVGLFELLKSWGLEPDVVVGHSVGEVASAYCSGALSLEDALLVSYHRSRLQKTLAGQGGMLAVGISAEEVKPHLAGFDQVEIAAQNSPNSITLAGEISELEALEDIFEELGLFNRMLKVEVPYHCAKMDPIQAELLDCLQSIQPQQNTIPLYSTVTATVSNGANWDQHYWWDNVRQAVSFSKTVQAISAAYGKAIYLEVGPHPVLKTSLLESLKADSPQSITQQTLNRKQAEWLNLKAAVASLSAKGLTIDWATFNGIEQGNFVNLPSYPWTLNSYKRLTKKSLEELFGQEDHVFFNQKIESIKPTWEVEFNNQFFPYVDDHKIEKNVVFPGAGYIEIGLALSQKMFPNTSLGLEQLQFKKMLADQETANVRLNVQYDEQTQQFSVQSRVLGQEDAWNVHALGKLIPNAVPPLGQVEQQDLQGENLDVEAFYEQLAARGLNYGPQFQTIDQLTKINAHTILAKLSKKAVADDFDAYYTLHPTLLDGAFQSMVSLVQEEQAGAGRPYVPVEIEQILVPQALPATFLSLVEVVEQADDTIVANIKLLDEAGVILAVLNGVKCQRFGQEVAQNQAINELFYQPKWQTYTPNALVKADPQDAYLLVGSGAVLEVLKAKMQALGLNYEVVEDQFNAENARTTAAYTTAFEALKEKAFAKLIYCTAFEVENGLDPKVVTTTLLQFKNFLQALVAHQGSQNTSIQVLSKAAHIVTVEDTGANMLAATLSAMGLLVQNEYANIHSAFADVDSLETLEQQLAAILLEDKACSERAYRGTAVYRQVLDRSTELATVETQYKTIAVNKEKVALRLGQQGDLDSFFYEERARLAPTGQQVEILVDTASLNFKDVLKVHNLLPTKAMEATSCGTHIGMEVTGTVVAVGAATTEFAVGDEVMAMATDAFQSYITLPTSLVMKKPDYMKGKQASATLAYLTAYHSLVRLAQLQEGEKVLIHQASGGVGLVALQIAKWKKAEIYATAGTPEKRAYLKEVVGLKHVYDSRSLAFVEQIKQTTNGYGVDVVLNAISGEGLIQSLNLLAPYGRFVEIGKKDIAENHLLPMRAFNSNLSFFSVDLDRMAAGKPAMLKALIDEVATCFGPKQLDELPAKVFPAKAVSDAFRYMAKGDHIGKVVLSFKEEEVAVVDQSQKNSRFDEKGTYLITGGTKGFGLEIAKWIAEQQVGRLVLVSRSGAKAATTKAAVEAWEAQGIEVVTKAVDVSDPKAVAQLISESNSPNYPLKGVFHAAAVLEDRFLAQLQEESLLKVLQPKLVGALNLHQYTQGLDLDIFLCFSSVSALIGNKGQAAYVMANSFLDALCQHRRALGLAATSINWGAISEVGMLARNKEVEDVLSSEGVISISPQEAKAALHIALETNAPQLGIFNIEWGTWANKNAGMISKQSRFEPFISYLNQDQDGAQKLIAIRDKFIKSIPNDRSPDDFAQYTILKSISDVLKFPMDQLDPSNSINTMGVDSLLAVELGVRISERIGVEFTAIDLLTGPSPAEMANKVLGVLELN